jgi:hypothetical protein
MNTHTNTTVNNMNKKPIEIFTGSTLVSLRYEPMRSGDGGIITAYTNGISLRVPSTTLKVPRLVSLFVDATCAAASCGQPTVVSELTKAVQSYL